MFNLLAVSADAFALHVAEGFKSTFGSAHHPVAKRLESVSRLAVECIARCNAQYHNLEHTLLVAVVGIEILRGMRLSRRLDPEEYAHMLIACLLHDIGYVRGVLRGDSENSFVVDAGGRRIRLECGASDASLAPYHVERSKLFACERLAHLPEIDVERIARAIEFTRFPVPADRVNGPETLEPRLVQAADLIGQLGDPLYLKKANALFYEFAELGINRQLGYETPADLVERYPDFFWSRVSPHLSEAMTFLNVTSSGRRWVANLHHNLFCAEHVGSRA
jgi:hypothetical protein